MAARVNSGGGVGNTFLADLIDPSAFSANCGRSVTGTTPCITAAQFATSTTQKDFGNTAPDMYRGAGYFNIDTNFTKNIQLREKMRFSLGFQFYNVLNHPNFANPSGSVTSSALGFISATVVPPTSIYGSFQSGTVSGRVGVVSGRFTF